MDSAGLTLILNENNNKSDLRERENAGGNKVNESTVY